MVGLLRRAGLLPKPKVSRDRALELARAECERRGWRWGAPVMIREWLLTRSVMTNAESIGGNATIWISSRSGVVGRVGFAAR
jgi:hypothetical protein